MKHTRTETVPATTRTAVYRVTCDLCGQEIQRGRRGNAEEVEVKHRTGSAYPEGGSGEEVSVDMCASCFDTKLVPWLREQGAQVQTTEWEF